jgi:hypothetical protein
MARGIIKRALMGSKPKKRSVQKRFEDDPQGTMDFAEEILGDDQIKFLKREGLSDLQIVKRAAAQVAVDRKGSALTQAQEGKTIEDVLKDRDRLDKTAKAISKGGQTSPRENREFKKGGEVIAKKSKKKKKGRRGMGIATRGGGAVA